jgi:hypothetical protein
MKLIRLVFFLYLFSCSTGPKNARQALEALDFVAIESVDTLAGFSESFTIRIRQPLDHENTDAGYFEQIAYVNHKGFDKPMVIETNGYAIGRKRSLELSDMLDANQLLVEYRFYGQSKPDSIPYGFLTNKQAVADYHHIVSEFKRFYNGKWISTGISKGGETALIYKRLYPHDVDVVVPYVAPLILSQEDERPTEHLRRVGTAADRQKIIDFQRAVLSRKKEMLPLLVAAETTDLSFSLPLETVLEYSVLEYSFSFWQWGHKLADIPKSDAPAADLFKHLQAVSGFYLYSDQGIRNYEPSFYQHMRELGYYAFDLEPVADLLVNVKDGSNAVFAPKGESLLHDENFIVDVKSWVESYGNHILYIYGANDPWFSCAAEPNEAATNAKRFVLEGGSHATRIRSFPKETQNEIITQLAAWLSEDK